jgi:hypothetical protein
MPATEERLMQQWSGLECMLAPWNMDYETTFFAIEIRPGCGRSLLVFSAQSLSSADSISLTFAAAEILFKLDVSIAT